MLENAAPVKKMRIGSMPEMVYNILKQSGTPMHHKDISNQVIQVLAPDPDAAPKLLARLHTEINLDNRFHHMGSGMWGLREWAPRRSMHQRQTASWAASPPRSRRTDLFRAEEEGDEIKTEEDDEWPKDDEDESERPEA
jgi:DNA-directed RNA polymerase subunit delta